jgi:DNA repair protein SbcC/Rad50
VLRSVRVRNFQSLRSADITLGRLTVITGPTGSGKSALFRAVRLLAFNARGTSYITSTEKSCSVMTGTDEWAMQITRSASSRGKNEYQTVDLRESTPCKYTKLAGQVPPQVSDLLALGDVNFARQFDPPFLLSVPGTELARKLGDLTNVSLVFGAAAEANRVRKQVVRELEGARARRDALLAELRQFAGLGERRKAVTAAEEALKRAQAVTAAIGRLEALADRLEVAEGTYLTAQQDAARQAPPSLDKLDDLLARAARLRELGRRLVAAQQDAERFAAQEQQARADERAAHDAAHAALVAAGQCPTCGSIIR